ncbi:MAG: hypothetical protein FWB85_11290 [Chitinispirillia bacterium]|nr:hypothetical protein [Chitinispirillia bacterium]
MNEAVWARIEANFAEAAELSKKNEVTLDRLEKAIETSAAEREKSYAKLEKAIFGVNREVNGISKSNGMAAEEYFFESLEESKTFGGMHFDRVRENIKNSKKLEDGSTLDGQYDIVMYNDTAVCIIEVKYRFKKDDVRNVAKWHAGTFKRLFPEYAGYEIYLGIGSMCFEEDVEEAARQLGIGVLKVKGDAVEIYDESLKTF